AIAVSQRFRHRFFYFFVVGVGLRNYFAFHLFSFPILTLSSYHDQHVKKKRNCSNNCALAVDDD
ncbi:MAG: hypothetical protein WAO04_05375, partial [Candidatus Sulfotelmatobacter sp.]